MILSILLIFNISCKKELNQVEPTDPKDKTMSDLVIPDSFDFTTSQTISLKVTSSDYLGLPATKIEIYNGNPNDGGNIVISGITDKSQVFETSFNLPASQETLHIRRTLYNGDVETATIDIDSNTLEYEFTTSKSHGDFKNGVTGPGCSDCSTSITGNESGILNINNGETVCILSGASFTGGLNMNGGTLKVCGNLTVQWINGSGLIMINDDGSFISTSLNINSPDLIIENYSDAFMVSSGPNINGTFKNWGYISLAGANINGGGKFYNYGIINFSNNYNNNNYTYNEGILNLAGTVANNGNAVFENHCRVNVAGNFNNNSTLDNYSFMEINGTLTLNGGGDLQLYDQALVNVVNMMINEDIVANGAQYSKLVVSGNTTINSASLSGNLDYCDENGIEINNGNIAASVTFCEASIPEDYCNPGSNGSGGGGEGPDADGDGVNDDFDDYPSDPDRAFNNYFPDADRFGTLAFEDLWPYKGDYDFNDLIIDYKFNTITNSNDNVVEMFITLKVAAIGAGYKNGFGIEFPFDPDAVSNVEGDFSLTQNIINLTDNNLEDNQNKTVVIFFDNAFSLLPHEGGNTGVNVQIGEPYVQPTEINFLISFNYPVSPDNMGLPPFNPFIFVNKERGREIHLINMEPTDLADASLFGTGQDASIPGTGQYYRTSNNLPWAINLVNGFDYPIEKAVIIDAYNYFSNWAESGGTSYTDWYTDETGYRNTEYIYTH